MFKSLFGGSSAKSAGNLKKVALVTNYNSCQLGLALANQFKRAKNHDAIVLVSADQIDQKDEDDGVHHFQAFLNEQDDL